MPAFLAISSAFLYAVSHIMTRVALRYARPSTGVLISLISCLVFSFALFRLNHTLAELVNAGFWFFLAAGITGPFWGRLFLYEGFRRVGVAVSTTVFEIKPIFSVLPAVILLGEGLSWPIVAGVILMMAGTFLVSTEKSGGDIKRGWSKKDLIFPMAAGACYGISHVIRKAGIIAFPDPVAAVLVQNIGAALFFPLLLVTDRSPKPKLPRPSLTWPIFILGGLLQVSAQWCLFAALEEGQVVVVSPLSSLNTFFVYLLALLFLRSLERLTWKIVLAGTLLVGATLLLTVFR